MTYFFNNMMKFGMKFTYKNTNVPIYRGIIHSESIKNDHTVGSLHIWTGFTSTTKEIDIAKSRSRDDDEYEQALIFEIYVSGCNDIATNIDTDYDKRSEKK